MNTNAVGKLGQIINAAGFTIKELTEFIWNTGVWASYGTVKKYCRASTRKYGKSEVWEAIDKFLNKYEIQWDGSDI